MSLRRERLDSGESLRLNPSPKCHFGSSVTGCDLYAEAAPPPPALARLRTPPRTQPCRVPAPAPGTAAPPAGSRPPCASIPAGRLFRTGRTLASARIQPTRPPYTRAPAGLVALLVAIVLLQPPPPRTPPSLLPSLPAAARPAPRCSVRAAPRLAGHCGQPLLAATEAGETDPKVTRNTLLKPWEVIPPEPALPDV
ncbi:PREDICTED: translation initiation factor IF-2-like [Sturnus vulgaris]|uniref:translation initiation factor IF-2-like n=1 Tax=Sturnus vulgaris TaxID=9172 RepID=UPI000719F689|nr:PREDICTED: translation initiation factor IF-2-like [Sturnus vulgaris]